MNYVKYKDNMDEMNNDHMYDKYIHIIRNGSLSNIKNAKHYAFKEDHSELLNYVMWNYPDHTASVNGYSYQASINCAVNCINHFVVIEKEFDCYKFDSFFRDIYLDYSKHKRYKNVIDYLLKQEFDINKINNLRLRKDLKENIHEQVYKVLGSRLNKDVICIVCLFV